MLPLVIDQLVKSIEDSSNNLSQYLVKPLKENSFVLTIPSARKGFSLNVWCGDCIAIGFNDHWHTHPEAENMDDQIRETIELVHAIIANQRKLVFNSKHSAEIYYEDLADIHYAPDEEGEKIIIGYWKDVLEIPWDIK